mmetsp:Transcript_3001/g.4564  ORF Transcript_3001/g.4564 Transcript_3001/m.4564 type:complete len:1404 (-) Transcript_3001:116-4327(-)
MDITDITHSQSGDGDQYEDHLFSIKVACESVSFSVDRNYVDFVEFHCKLEKDFPKTSIPSLPLEAKTKLQSLFEGGDDSAPLFPNLGTVSLKIDPNNTERIENKKHDLLTYMRNIISIESVVTSPALMWFLDGEQSDNGPSTYSTESFDEISFILRNTPAVTSSVKPLEEETMTATPGQLLLWRFHSDGNDVGFSILAGGNEKLPFKRYRTSEVYPMTGMLEAKESMSFTLKWDCMHNKDGSGRVTRRVRVVESAQYEECSREFKELQKQRLEFANQRRSLKIAAHRRAAELGGVVDTTLRALVSTETPDIMHELTVLRTENETLGMELNRVQGEVEVLNDQNISLRSELETCNNRISELNDELVVSDNHIDELEEAMSAVQEEKEVLARKITELTEIVDAAGVAAELSAAREKNIREELEEQVAALKDKVSGTLNDPQSLGIVAVDEEVKRLKAELLEAQEALAAKDKVLATSEGLSDGGTTSETVDNEGVGAGAAKPQLTAKDSADAVDAIKLREDLACALEQISQQEASLGELQEANTKLSKDFSNMMKATNRDVEGKRAEIAKLQDELAAAEEVVKKKEAVIVSLEERYNSLLKQKANPPSPGQGAADEAANLRVELASALESVARRDNTIRTLQENHDKLSKLHGELTKSLDRVSKENSSATSIELSQLHDELNDALVTLFKKDTTIRGLEDNVSKLTKLYGDLKEDSAKELEEKNSTIAALRVELGKATESAPQKDATIQYLEDKAATLSKQYTELKESSARSIESNAAEISRLRAEVVELTTASERKDAAVRDAEGKVKDLPKLRGDLAEALETIARKDATIRDLEGTHNKLSKLHTELNRSTSRHIEGKSTEVSRLRDDLASALDSISQKEETIRNLEKATKEMAKLKRDLVEAQEAVTKKEASIRELEKKSNELAKLYDMSTKDSDAARKELAALREQLKDYLRACAAERDLEECLSTVREKFDKLEKEHEVLEESRRPDKERIKLLEDQIEKIKWRSKDEIDGLMSAASEMETALDAVERELSECQADLKKSNADKSALQKTVDDNTKHMKELSSKVAKLEKAVTSKTDEAQRAKKAADDAVADLDRLKAQHKDDLERFEMERKNREKLLRSFQNELSDAHIQLENTQQRLQELKALSPKSKKADKALAIRYHKEMAAARSEVADYAQELVEAARREDDLQRTVLDMQQEMAMMAGQLQFAQMQLYSQFPEPVRNSRYSDSFGQSKMRRSSSGIEDADKIKQMYLDSTQRCSKLEEELRTERESSSARDSSAVSQLAQLQSRIEEAHQEKAMLLEQIEAERSAAAESLAQMQCDLESMQRENEELKRALDAKQEELNTVMMSLSEMEELNGRRLEELEASRAQLRRFRASISDKTVPLLRELSIMSDDQNGHS